MRAYDPKKAAQYHDEIHAHVPSESALRVKALESLLVEKGLVDPGAIDARVDIYRDQVGPKIGAWVVARAWTDAAYKTRLSPMGPLPLRNWASKDGRSDISKSLRTQTSSTTSSFAPCALAIQSPCWACHHPGTRKRLTGRERCASRDRAGRRDTSLPALRLSFVDGSYSNVA
jgi:hypothetical protein